MQVSCAELPATVAALLLQPALPSLKMEPHKTPFVLFIGIYVKYQQYFIAVF